MTREQCEAEAQRARECGWLVTADLSALGWWLRCESADGDGHRYAGSRVALQALIVGGAVARKSS